MKPNCRRALSGSRYPHVKARFHGESMTNWLRRQLKGLHSFRVSLFVVEVFTRVWGLIFRSRKEDPRQCCRNAHLVTKISTHFMSFSSEFDSLHTLRVIETCDHYYHRVPAFFHSILAVQPNFHRVHSLAQFQH